MSGVLSTTAIVDADMTTDQRPMLLINGRSVSALTVGKIAHQPIANVDKNAPASMNALRKDVEMTKIPDEVVKLAVKTMAKAPKDNGTVENFMAQMARAAGEVFVAWEREQCIEIAHRHKSKVEINEPLWHEGQDWACQRIADAIEARSAPEKE